MNTATMGGLPAGAFPLRAILLTAALLLAAAMAHYMRPVQAPTQLPDLERVIPRQIGDWKVDPTIVPVLPSADVQANLDQVYDAILARTYINSKGERMMLSLAYTAQQGGKAKPHWQEICYRAQGFIVSGLHVHNGRIADREVPISRFVGRQRGRVEPVSYWLTLGDQVITDRWERFVHLLKLSLRRQTTDGFLVRVSSVDPQAEAAFQKQAAFAGELMRALPPEMAVRLSGRR